MVMPRKGMALVEMEDIEGAKELVEGAATTPIMLHGRRVLCNFSTVGIAIIKLCQNDPVRSLRG
jgi:hypothetical protein